MPKLPEFLLGVVPPKIWETSTASSGHGRNHRRPKELPTPKEEPKQYRYSISPDDPFEPKNDADSFNLFRLVGGKGFALWEICKVVPRIREGKVKLPVPKFFTLTTEAWSTTRDHSYKIPNEIWEETLTRVRQMEQKTKMKFGEDLTVSARSGSIYSMPGRMDTILNIGITEKNIARLSKRIGMVATWQSYFELVHLFGTAVYGINKEEFADLDRTVSSSKNVTQIQQAVQAAKRIISTTDPDFLFPEDPYKQLEMAVGAVFRSWDNPRVVDYRKREHIPDVGTACSIVEMKYGNSSKAFSGSAVFFTHDPKNYGEPILVFGKRQQGNKVVADEAAHETITLDALPAKIRRQLREVGQMLESYYHDTQDIEVTIENGKIFFLQTRRAEMSSYAYVRRSLNAIAHGWITPEEAIRRTNVSSLLSVLGGFFDSLDIADAERKGLVLAKGRHLSSTGYATGQVVKSVAEARSLGSKPAIVHSFVHMGNLDDLPPNVVGAICTNACVLAHVAIDLRHLGRRMPVTIGVDNERIISGQIVTIDGVNGVVFEGEITPSHKDTSELLIPAERKTVEEWLELIRKNPWHVLVDPRDESENRLSILREMSSYFNENIEKFKIKSHKAHEVFATQLFFPEANVISIPYHLVSPKDKDGLQKLLLNIIAKDKHATIRTCHVPTMKGKGHYATLRRVEDIEKFFSSPDGYAKLSEEMQTNERGEIFRLTEFAVGEIPKGKMDEELAHWHCAITISVADNVVTMQIRPHTPLLRDLEEVENKHIISTSFSFDAERGEFSHLGNLEIGSTLQDDLQAQQWASTIFNHIYVNLWTRYNFPLRMSWITDHFPPPRCATPGIEMQARMKEDGTISWILIYGIKADEADNHNGETESVTIFNSMDDARMSLAQ